MSDDAFNNWGTSLSDLANLQSDSDGFIKSFEKFKKAVKLNKRNDSAYINWGSSISRLASLESRPELFEEGIEKYNNAILINPQNEHAYSNLASAFLDYSYMIEDPDAKLNFLIKAQKNAQYAYDLGNITYNLACTNSLLMNKENAFKYLEKSLQNKEIHKTYVTADRDWSAYQDDPEFLKILSKY